MTVPDNRVYLTTLFSLAPCNLFQFISSLPFPESFTISPFLITTDINIPHLSHHRSPWPKCLNHLPPPPPHHDRCVTQPTSLSVHAKSPSCFLTLFSSPGTSLLHYLLPLISSTSTTGPPVRVILLTTARYPTKYIPRIFQRLTELFKMLPLTYRTLHIAAIE